VFRPNDLRQIDEDAGESITEGAESVTDAKHVRAAELDETDRTLIALLREDARTSNARLAELAGIAPSTCLVRLRSLRERGVIRGYAPELDPAALGWRLQALVSVSIRSGARGRVAGFLAELRAVPEVVQVFFVGGAEDFVVHLVARDSDDVRDFVLERLSSDPIVAGTRTSMVFDHRWNGTPVPPAP
jgi:DNA-binding Lrp family transcriptional regulator